jgi:WhiB family transcriptional regulator, redox-sensing transcriptional regulator
MTRWAVQDINWMDQAACRKASREIFFPTNANVVEPALNYCRGCKVSDECYVYALADRDLVGIWSGTTERDRQRIRRKLAGVAWMSPSPTSEMSEK